MKKTVFGVRLRTRFRPFIVHGGSIPSSPRTVGAMSIWEVANSPSPAAPLRSCGPISAYGTWTFSW